MTGSAASLGSHAEAVAAAEAFAAAVRPGAADRDRAGNVPRVELAEFDRSGLAAITVPAADGGSGLGPVTLAEVIRTIAAADPALAQIPQGHFLAIDVLRLLGTPEQRSRVLSAVTEGGRVAPVLAERGGTHALDLKTRLVADGPSWRLTASSTTAPVPSPPAGWPPARWTPTAGWCWHWSSATVRG